MMDVDLIKSAVTIIFYPKGSGPEQFIVLDQLYIANSMDLLSPFDHLVGAVRVNVFD